MTMYELVLKLVQDVERTIPVARVMEMSSLQLHIMERVQADLNALRNSLERPETTTEIDWRTVQVPDVRNGGDE